MITVLLIFLCFEQICMQETVPVVETGKKLSEQIIIILEHYKNDDPIGIPGIPIPDPLPIPPLRQSHPVATLNFKNVSLYGLSKFRLKTIQADLTNMNVQIELKMDILDVQGMYSMSSWFTRSNGPFYVKLTNVTTKTFANLTVNSKGNLQAQNMDLDISVEDIAMDFENLNFLGNVFQGIINSVGIFIFDSLKPFITKEINSDVRGDINNKLSEIPKKFPNSIPPLDLIIFEIRKKFQEYSMDPLILSDYNYSVGLIGLQLVHNQIHGFSTFYRDGNISFNISNHFMYFGFNMNTLMITGSNEWNLIFGTSLISRSGYITFNVNYVNVRVILCQSMDVRNHPTIEDIQLEIGNIQIRFDGAGTFDYLVELAINIMPNLLRYQLMDALENPIRDKIQEALDNVHLENIIHEKTEDIDRVKEQGFDMDYFFEQLKHNLH